MSQALIKHYEKREEGGFTLIELLVVIIIIGILAAIAIPVFLNQRERAWRSAAESDLRNVALEVESVYTDQLEYPDADQWDDIVADFRWSAGLDDGDNVTYYIASGAGDPEGFCMEAVHDRIEDGDENVALYNSLEGGLQPRDSVVEDYCTDYGGATFTVPAP